MATSLAALRALPETAATACWISEGESLEVLASTIELLGVGVGVGLVPTSELEKPKSAL